MRLDAQQARTASTQVIHEVFRNDVSTGRRFTSLPAAQRYAQSIGGTIRPLA